MKMADKRKPWTAPKLIHHGNVTDLTKGGSAPGMEGGEDQADGTTSTPDPGDSANERARP